MQSCERVSLDDAEAAQVKLYPLLLLNYSQFVILGGLPLLLTAVLLVMSPLAEGYQYGVFAAFWGALKLLLAFALIIGLFRFVLPLVRSWLQFVVPLVRSWLQAVDVRWIVGAIAAAAVIYFWFLGISGVFPLVVPALLLLPFAQSSVVCRLNRWPLLAAAVLAWTGIAIGALLILGFASDLDIRRNELILMVLGLSPAYAWAWSLATRFWSLSRISDRTRSLLRAHFRSVFSWEALRTFAGVPPVWSYLQSNKKLTLALFLLTNLFGGLAMIAILTFTTIGSRVIKIPAEGLFLALLILVVAFATFWMLMRICNSAAHARTRISAGELIATDLRKPILFLRAFADDHVALPHASLGPLGTALSLGRHRKTFDELLVEEGTIYGPVVALGNPNDKVPPYGVARGYFQNTEWKKAVSDLARESVLIVVCIDNTDSVWWEVEHIFRNGYAGKTLFVLPPKHRLAGADKSLLPRLIQHLPSVPEATLRELVEACSRSDTLAVSIDRSGGVSIAASQTFSGFAYLMLLRWFLRSRLPDGVAQTTFAAAPESAFAKAGAIFGAAPAAAAATPGFSAAAAPADTDEPEPSWVKIVRKSAARMGLLGSLVVMLIEALYRLAGNLMPKLREAARDWRPQASATTEAASASIASASFVAGEYAQNFGRKVRNFSRPAWIARTNALIAAGGLTAFVLVIALASRPSPTQTAATRQFTPAPSAGPSSSSLPTVAEGNAAYQQLYRNGFVFDPNDVSRWKSDPAPDDCQTASSDAELAGDASEKRRLNNLVIRECTRVLRSDRGNADALVARGKAYMDLGRKSEAIADLRKAQAIDPLRSEIAGYLDDLQDQEPRRKRRKHR